MILINRSVEYIISRESGTSQKQASQKERAMLWNVKSNRRREGTPLSYVSCAMFQVHYGVVWALRVQLCRTAISPQPPDLQRAICYYVCSWRCSGVLPLSSSHPISCRRCPWPGPPTTRRWEVCLISHFTPTKTSQKTVANQGQVRSIWSRFHCLRQFYCCLFMVPCLVEVSGNLF